SRQGVVGGNRVTGDPAAVEYGEQVLVDHRLVRIAAEDVADIQDASQLGHDAGLFQHLAERSVADRLAELDASAREAPQAPEGALLAALDQQHLAAAKNGRAGGAARPKLPAI